MTHSACWRDPPVSTLNGLSDLGIGLVYFAIAGLLIYTYIKFAPFSWKFWNRRYYLAFAFFAAFIFSCGFGHVLEYLATWWWPRYDLIGYWKAVTFSVSALTLASMAVVLPAFLTNVVRADTALAAVKASADKARKTQP